MSSIAFSPPGTRTFVPATKQLRPPHDSPTQRAALVAEEGSPPFPELAPGVEADVLTLKAAALGSPAQEPLAPPSGTLLPSYDLDECPEFARWLDGARLAVEGWKRRARELALLPAWRSAAPAGAIRLPREVVGTLIRLARIGHVQGLRAALDDALLRHPECEPEGRRLQALVERF